MKDGVLSSHMCSGSQKRVLTIIVPAFNIAPYLERNVCSVAMAGNRDLIEVEIVDDGSTDETPSVAKGLIERFPDLVSYHRKENGHYGTAVNYGVRHAQGAYVKIVDGDDYVDSGGLERLVAFLAGHTGVDMVITDFKKQKARGMESEHVQGSLPEERVFEFDDFEFFPPEMHALSYRRDLLVDNDIWLDGGVPYTDVEFVVFPSVFVRTVAYVPSFVYLYQIGRAGQSVDIDAVDRNIGAHFFVLNQLLDWYEHTDFSRYGIAHERYAARRIGLMAADYVRAFATCKHPGRFRDDALAMETRLAECPMVDRYCNAKLRSVFKLTGYRFSAILSFINRMKRKINGE